VGDRRLADALGDPTLRLTFWLPERAEWVDAEPPDRAVLALVAIDAIFPVGAAFSNL
jgi:hypothetical protein